MTFVLDENTVAGRVIAERHFVRGEARGLARGRIRERVATLSLLLCRAFGDDERIDDVAHALALLPRREALELALTAPSLDCLADPPAAVPAAAEGRSRTQGVVAEASRTS